MPSDKQCCVPGCKKRQGKEADTVLHGFPNPEKDRDRFNTWLYAIGGDILILENKHIFKYRRVCRSHFEHKYLCRYNNLSKIAVPTLYMPGIPLHRFPNPNVNAEKYNSWVSKIGGAVATMDNLDVYGNRRVCNKHFEEIHKYPKNRLCKLAIPVLNLPEQLHTEAVTLTDLASTSGYQRIPCEIPMKGKDAVLHRFPNPEKDRDRFNTWLCAIGGDILALENEHIFKYRRVCRSHFEHKYLCRCNNLSRIAVPTLYMPGADDTILHVFPNPEKELDRFNKWMYAIGGNVFVIKPETVFKHGRVCHNHFDAKYYTSSRRLSRNAVPSLKYIQGKYKILVGV